MLTSRPSQGRKSPGSSPSPNARISPTKYGISRAPGIASSGDAVGEVKPRRTIAALRREPPRPRPGGAAGRPGPSPAPTGVNPRRSGSSNMSRSSPPNLNPQTENRAGLIPIFTGEPSQTSQSFGANPSANGRISPISCRPVWIFGADEHGEGERRRVVALGAGAEPVTVLADRRPGPRRVARSEQRPAAQVREVELAIVGDTEGVADRLREVGVPVAVELAAAARQPSGRHPVAREQAKSPGTRRCRRCLRERPRHLQPRGADRGGRGQPGSSLKKSPPGAAFPLH